MLRPSDLPCTLLDGSFLLAFALGIRLPHARFAGQGAQGMLANRPVVHVH